MEASRWSTAKRVLLAALERPAEAREAYLDEACAGDAAMRSEVAALLAADAAAGERFETPPIVVAPSLPRLLGSYRVVGELGRGGMGTVYLAEREGDDFRQRVAIKVIRHGMDSDAIVRRFRHERRILASLNHANIARLYEGGTTAEGLPYFVMEHVDGEPIDRWCAARDASTAERLRLFRQVCAAVHYAHQNLVVHRDLKPGNILVTADGVPKLLDFGIAKLLDAESPAGADLTAMTRPMTPAYASPEQVRGEPVTTASDVYSLGVLLYELLTGRPPYRIDREAGVAEVIRIVSEEEAAPPSETTGERNRSATTEPARRLSADVDAIVLQAMRKDPARRYASANDLSEDLRRLLDGLPVAARRDSHGYRARKFVARHRLGVTAAAAAFVALVATTASAVHQARVAEEQRARAERHFADVRRLATSFLFEFHDAIQDLPGATGARDLVVRKALEYLDGLAAEAGSDRGLLVELAQAYERVGDVQGMPYRASLGHSGDALHSYERALALRQRLLRLEPRSPGYRLGRAGVEGRVGSVLAARGDTARALERHRLALAEVSALWANERYPAALVELPPAAVAVGDDLWELGHLDDAIARYQVALGSAQERRRGAAANREARRYVGVVEQRIGDALALQGRWPQSLEHQQASLAVDRDLAAANPGSAETQRDLATDYTRLAVAHEAMGDRPAALAEHRQALAIRERLHAVDPKDSRALTDLAESLSQLGESLANAGDYPAALVSLRRALPLRRAQAATDPDNLRWRDDLASALTHYGTTLGASGDRVAGRAALLEALALRESIAVAAPALSESNAALANLYVSLAQLSAPGPPGDAACHWLIRADRAYARLRDRGALTGEAVAAAANAHRQAGGCGDTLAPAGIASR